MRLSLSREDPDTHGSHAHLLRIGDTPSPRILGAQVAFFFVLASASPGQGEAGGWIGRARRPKGNMCNMCRAAASTNGRMAARRPDSVSRPKAQSDQDRGPARSGQASWKEERVRFSAELPTRSISLSSPLSSGREGETPRKPAKPVVTTLLSMGDRAYALLRR